MKVEGGKNFFENVPKSCYECENPTSEFRKSLN
jgi:hypothetical protein